MKKTYLIPQTSVMLMAASHVLMGSIVEPLPLPGNVNNDSKDYIIGG